MLSSSFKRMFSEDEETERTSQKLHDEQLKQEESQCHLSIVDFPSRTLVPISRL